MTQSDPCPGPAPGTENVQDALEDTRTARVHAKTPLVRDRLDGVVESLEAGLAAMEGEAVA